MCTHESGRITITAHVGRSFDRNGVFVGQTPATPDSAVSYSCPTCGLAGSTQRGSPGNAPWIEAALVSLPRFPWKD
jgi:hypothetical protein